MKLKDLFEEQKVFHGAIKVRLETTKLDYEDVIVKGNFDSSYTRIESLEGSPSRVDGYFYCYNTPIASLEGCPRYVGGTFNCHSTQIRTLHNVHKQVDYIGGYLYLSNTIKSHILGVMFIKGLKYVEFVDKNQNQILVADIINKHLAGDRNPHECQQELIEAGLSDYAKI